MSRLSTSLLSIALILSAAACNKAAVDVPTVNKSMTQVMEPSAQTVWDIMGQSYNDNGDALDPAKISQADWDKVAQATLAMKERAILMATAKGIKVATDDVKIMGEQAVGTKGKAGPEWDAVSAKTVQARIEAKPELWTQKAHELADAADAMHRAATTKDAALLYSVGSRLDEVCDSCHEPFWGTDEPPPVKH